MKVTSDQGYDGRRPAGASLDLRASSSLHGRDPRRPIALVATLMVLAGLLGGGLVFAWERVDGDQGRSLANAIAERDAARDEVATLSDRLDGLEAKLAAAGARTTELQSEVRDAQRQLLALLGPALPDGKHFGHLFAVGAAQRPPRLVIDIEQWFTDQAAVDAAIEDGVSVDPGINGYYIRNVNPRWRTIEIDPAATVSLATYPYGDPSDPTVVSLKRFGKLFSSYDGRLLQYSPFWITVEDAHIVAIEEQFIP
jgi:hypothetical protein